MTNAGDDRWTRGPGVRVPPPLMFVAAGLVAWWLDTRIGFTIDGRGAGVAQRAIGWLFVGAGLAVVVAAFRTLLAAHTTFDPGRAATSLVIAGPYRRTRNPIYLGFSAIFFGIALLLNSGWMILMLPVVMLTVSALVIRREELHLSAVFGEAYEKYTKKVRRWL